MICKYDGGRLLGRFSSISSGVKKRKKESAAAKYIGLPGQPMLDREA